MRPSLRLALLLPLLFLAACRKVPDHARFIPKNALSVVGINVGAIGKKITWPALLGADVRGSFDSFALQKGYHIRAEDLQNSGLDRSSTVYVCFLPTGNAINRTATPEAVAILPLENSGKWSAFLQKTFPRMQALPATGGKAAQLDSNLVVLWTDNVAFLRNAIRGAGSYQTLPDSTEEWQEGAPDRAATLASLEALPKLAKEESIVSDDRFTLLAKSNRDVIAWLNYEQMMSSPGGMGAALGMMGSKIYKGAAMTATAEFKDGAIEAEFNYFTSDELRDVSRKMGAGAIPKEMIARLPKENMDGFAAANISLDAFRMLLEKIGLLGIVNMGLSAQRLSIDDITEALTGDIAASVNDFKTVAVTPVEPQFAPSGQTRPSMDYVVALRLGKPEKVAKLLQFLLDRKLVEQVSPNLYVPFGNTADGGVLMLDHDYAVAARTQQQAQAYLSGTAQRELPVGAKEAVGTGPVTFFVNFQQVMKGIDTSLMRHRRERLQWLESQRVFADLTVNGGSFSTDHLSYHGRLKLLNQQENALLQLLRYANRMSEIERSNPVSYDVPAFDSSYAPNAVF